MGDTPPSTTAPPAPPRASNMALLYYGLAVVGTAAVLLVMYNLIVLRWCGYTRSNPSPGAIGSNPSAGRLEAGGGSSRSFDNPNAHLVSSFKYKKEGASGKESTAASYNEYECAVCLSVFEEDEELKQLPKCKHSFHAPCIDMWLYSHPDCPLCRSPVDPPGFLNRIATTTPTRVPMPSSRVSREGLIAGFAI